MADVRISALPQQQTPLTGLELVPIVQNGLTVQTTISLINALSAGGVTTFSGGATGLLPSSPTVGAITLAGMLNATYGGTGIAAYAAGDLLRANSTTTLQRLAIGTNGQVLTVVAGAPAWAAVSTGTVTSVGGTGTVNGLTLTGTVTSSGNLTLGGVLDLSSPPAIGGTAAAAGTFTTLRVDSTISLAGSTGTAGYVLTSQGASAPTWTAVSSGSGNVVGPASATANGIALFDGTTGLLLKNSSSVDALIRGMKLGVGNGAGNFASTALGVSVLQNNTSGSYNIGVGYEALFSNTTGEFNSALGFYALRSQTTSTENTAFGYYGLYSASTGSYNTALGGNAGYGVTTGSRNLFLGVDSGNNLTTGSNNVYIGKVTAFSPSESNNLVFGDGTGERFRITATGAWYINADTGTNGQAFLSRGASLPPAWQSLGTMSTQDANNVAITGGAISDTSITVADNVFTLQDNVDPTKQAQFQLSGLATGTTIAYTLPATATTLAGLSIANTWLSTNSFTSLNNSFGTYAGSATSNTNIASGAQTGTKTVNIGTGGLSGSTTAITVGSANGSTTTMLGSTVIGGVAGNQSLQVNNVVGSVDYLQVLGNSGGFPSLSAQGASTNVSIVYGTKGTGTHNFTTGGLTFNQFVVAHTASAVNQLNITGSTTGAPIIISAQGSDTNVSLAYAPKGTGRHTFYSNSGTQFVVGNTASAVNYAQTDGAATGAAPTLSAQGSDANINLKLTPKGTGVVTVTSDAVINGMTVGLGGGSIAQNAAFGGVTLPFNTTGNFNVALGYQSMFWNKIGSSNVGLGFASLFLNTTDNQNLAMGVSALTVLTTNVATFGTITAGSGYTNGTYTAVAMTPVSGATFVTYPTVTVVVSGGSVTSVTLVTAGQGASSQAATVLTVAAALIGGTGSGFSISVSSFASGGNNTAIGFQAGSALATGSNNTIIGSQASASTTTVNNEITLGNSSVTAFRIPGLSITAAPSALTIGSQFAVTNTAFAINYAQVTGAATGNAPTISAQGSDADISLVMSPKGTGVTRFTKPIYMQRTYGTGSLIGLGGNTAYSVGANASGFDNDSVIDSTKTSSYSSYSTYLSTAAAGFTLFALRHYSAQLFQLGAGSAVTNQYGFFTDNSLIGATNNYGFFSGITAAAGRFNFYANGTAANVFVGQTSLGGTVGAEALRAVNTASAVNYVQALGAITTGAPELSAQGSDANINLKLTPKGTGVLQFGTYTAGIIAQAGYITITDAGGTSRRLLVG